MRLLFIHADSIEYEAVKPAGSFAESLRPNERKGRMEEVLTVFIAVEKVDEASPEAAVSQAAVAVKEVAGQVKTNRVMLYPYAHLSRDLSSPDAAKSIFKSLEGALKDGFEVKRSPFGWYKKFNLAAKGHPMAELSKEIIPGKAETKAKTVLVKDGAPKPPAAPAEAGKEEKVSDAVAKEAQLRSEWFILTPKGDFVPGAKFDFKGHDDLKTFYQYESQKVRVAKEEAPHIKIMQELELVDYEPGSDSGNFRWYPKGQLIKRLLEEQVRRICARHGAMQVETPIMYDTRQPALAQYLNRFPARQYRIVADDREFFLRFAACFGQYLIMHDATLSYRNLPFRLLEITHYSFRREQRGELTGIKRLRTFTMPDMHTLCADMDQAKGEFLRQYELTQGWFNDLGLPYEMGLRVVKDFYEANRGFYQELVNKIGKPVLVEMWNDRFFYFVTKFELNVIDAVDKAAALSTVQIDVENAERFGIQFTDQNGARKHPLLLHTSVSGSIDRCLYVLLEREFLKTKKGLKPMLPFWLAPVQIRLLPVADGHVEACRKLKLELLEASGKEIRIEIDDREEGIGRKIRDAEKDWVPIIVVFGDKEKGSGRFEPRFRREDLLAGASGKKEFSAGELGALSGKLQGTKPTAPLALPETLALQPKFRG